MPADLTPAFALLIASLMAFAIGVRGGVATLTRFKEWLRRERPGVYQELAALPALADRRVARFLIKRHYRDRGDQDLWREAQLARNELLRSLVVLALAVILALFALSRY